MNYSDQELGFILYNNRSVNGVVSNFIPKEIDGYKLIKIEEQLDWCKSIYEKNDKFIEIEKNQLDLNSNDINLTPDELSNLQEEILNSKLSDAEHNYLTKRGINEEVIKKYELRGLSNIINNDTLIKLNATCHPILKNILSDGIEGGGIIIPYIENNKLLNCAIRKLSDVGKLKYSLSCPDIDVWGIDDINVNDTWICEGLFDMMALRSINKKAISVSSAMWSGIQIYKLLEKNPKSINIFCDNDRVGLKTGCILKRFFTINEIETKTYISQSSKDASESIFEKKLKFEKDIIEIKITKEMINNKQDDSFNFLRYLKTRKF